MGRDIIISFTSLFLFGIFTPSYQTTLYVDNLHFLSSARVLDIDNVQWFNADTQLLLSNGFINKVIDNQIAVKQVTPEEAVLLGTTPAAAVFCDPSTGRVHQVSLNQLQSSAIPQSSDLFGLTTVCGKGGILSSFRINDSFYTISNVWDLGKIYKFNQAAGTLISTNDVSDGKPIKYVKSVFSSGGFVYSVYTNDKNRVEISRFCENDAGVEGVFSTHRYGAMACTSHGVKHDVLLDAKFDPASSRLALLLTHAPVELSSRVLCYFSLHRIDNVMDTGDVQFYDEMGRRDQTPATQINCDLGSNPGYLNNHIVDTVRSSHVVLAEVEGYKRFGWREVGGERVWYLATDTKLDIMAHLITSATSSLAPLQTISTGFLPSQITNTGNEVVLVRESGIVGVDPFLCGQLKTPNNCYTGRYCKFLAAPSWSCTFSPSPGTFLGDHPGGLVREETFRGGCAVRVTQYLEGQDLVQEHEVTCDLPPLPPHSHYASSNTSCLGRLEAACDPGAHLISGDLVRQCLQTGEWSGTTPSCKIRSCPTLYPSPDSLLSSESTAIGSTVTVSCSDDCETPSTSPYILCQESGQWNASLPYCTRAFCQPLPVLKHTVLLHTDHTPTCGSRAVFTCAPGTNLVYGDLVRQCDQEGAWSGHDPLCTITNCPPFPAPQNSHVTGSSTYIRAMVTVTCDRCHQVLTEASSRGFSSSVTSQCLSSGAWSVSEPQCRRVTCPPLTSPDGVSMKLLNTSCYGTAQFECATGHVLESGSLYRMCQPDGKWSGSQPRCGPQECAWVTPGPSVEVVLRGSSYGEKSIYRCTEGSHLTSGVLERWCLPGGRWSGGEPECSPELLGSLASLTMAPEQVSSSDSNDSSNGWRVVAVCGWVLFIVTAIFVATIVVLLKRGQLRGIEIIGSLERKSSFERQITQSTNIGTLDSRKSRSVETDTVTC